MRPFGRRAPDRLLIAPQDLRTSDPTIAAEIYAGQLKFAGKLMETHGRSPFELPPPSEAFAAELYGFAWLRHLRAAETALSRANGRALVADWMAAQKRGLPPVATRPEVAARRLISWLSQTPLLLEGADAPFYRAFVKCVAQEARRLQRGAKAQPPGEVRLLMQIALMHYALAAADNDAHIKTAATELCAALDEQVMPDGGHITRNTGVILNLLLDLLPLKLAFISRRIQTPRPIMSAMDRMIPMLRMMRHGDGSIALFNGMGATRADLVAAVLALDDIVASPPLQAPYAGYQRVEAGQSVLLVDAGVPPAPPLAQRAHAAPAAFEFSAENQRIVVNCGAPPLSRPDLAPFARLTAAHSTVTVADETIGRFRRSALGGASLGEQYVGGASKVEVNRADGAGGSLVSLTHDGYQRRFRLIHGRKLALSADGGVLAGEDKLTSNARKPADHAFALRFHLHPAVRASLSEDQRTAYLMLPNRSAWEFQAAGMALRLEEDAFFATAEGTRRSLQIVVESTTATQATVAWTFRKSGRSAPAPASAARAAPPATTE
ncbi:MAG: heparinase II/III family protein [Beijerinckiaceae bacterium]